LHGYRARNAKMIVQRAQHFLRRIFGRIAPPRRVWELRGRPEYVAMRIGRAGRQLEARLTALGEEGGVNVHRVRLAKRVAAHKTGISPRSQPTIVSSRKSPNRPASTASRIPAISSW